MAQKEPTGWVGWVYFAGAMMVLVGALQFVAGLVALFKDEYYLVAESGLVVFDYTSWGWIHMLLGLFLLWAGSAVVSGRTWGRMVGVFLAVLGALSHIVFFGAYPFWSLIAIVVNILVIYALTVHGGEAQE